MTSFSTDEYTSNRRRGCSQLKQVDQIQLSKMLKKAKANHENERQDIAILKVTIKRNPLHLHSVTHQPILWGWGLGEKKGRTLLPPPPYPPSSHTPIPGQRKA